MKPEILTHINDQPIFGKIIGTLPYNKELSLKARALRKAGNFPEVIFWRQVRNGMFWNIDFDRQRIIGNFIVDFYVKSLGLIIEIDGSSHNGKEEYDKRREDYLISLGLKFFRVSDFRIKNNLDNVMIELENFVIIHFGNDCG